tara:strand:+ start:505 stop:774 length:270 start_codon:yes stop_codon:yes gene_type:complete
MREYIWLLEKLDLQDLQDRLNHPIEFKILRLSDRSGKINGLELIGVGTIKIINGNGFWVIGVNEPKAVNSQQALGSQKLCVVATQFCGC